MTGEYQDGPGEPGDTLEIGAWLDGMLDRDGAERMNERVATDAALAARAERMRHVDGLIRSAVPLDDALPADLLERLGLGERVAGEPAPVSNVVNLSDARQNRLETAAAPVRPAARGWGRMAAQVALVSGLALGAALWLAPQTDRADRAEYRTLSDRSAAVDAGTPAANVLVIFADGTAPDRASAIAASAGARLIGQPSEAGAWQAVVEPARRDAVLDALRRDGAVTLAEPIDGAPR